MFKDQFIEFDVNSFQPGIPVGYRFYLSLYKNLNPLMYTLTTDLEDRSDKNTFFYSLDGGINWFDYPLGDVGKIFNSPYKMRVKINSARAGFVICERNSSLIGY